MKYFFSRRHLTVVFALGFAPFALIAQTTQVDPPSPSSADHDFAVFWQMLMDPKSATGGKPSPSIDDVAGRLRWGSHFYRSFYTQGMAFYEKHPTDPRRWRVVGQLLDKSSWLKEPTSPELVSAANEIISPEERAAWRKKIEQLRLLGIKAADTPPEERYRFEWFDYFLLIEQVKRRNDSGQPVDFGPLKRQLDHLIARYPAENKLAGTVRSYMRQVELAGASTADIRRHWEEFARSPHEAVRQRAVEQLRLLELGSKPIELAFTAVDGRAVDLKDLRGKVVLVDFWATWCGPCIAEIPNIKKVYAEYRAKGFEIIGIALENARLAPGDSAEQAAAKHEKAKKVLNDFTAKNDMPWPQYYDGKHWKNDISTRFGIAGIPAMFLIDQSGKIVSTEARGPKLETEVKRLLGL